MQRHEKEKFGGGGGGGVATYIWDLNPPSLSVTVPRPTEDMYMKETTEQPQENM